MDHFTALLSLIGLLFVSVIGVYVWTYKVSNDVNKNLTAVYTSINLHHQRPEIHGKVADLTTRVECAALHGALKADVIEIKADVKTLLVKAGV